MRRNLWLLGAVVALLVIGVVASPASSAPEPKPSKAEVLKAHRSNSTVAAEGEVVPVSFEEAAAAAELPGAVTEGQVPFLGLQPASPKAGGGLGTQSAEGGGGGNACWYRGHEHSIGLGPYHRATVLYTYWCARYGDHITYRSSNAVPRTSGFCSVDGGPWLWKVSGGAGYRWVTVHAEFAFSCATPWWFRLHDNVWLEVAYNVWGTAEPVRWS